MLHDLKIHPHHFACVTDEDVNKRKTVELRFNDRDFKVGDELNLMEFDPYSHKMTGNNAVVKVTHVLFGQTWLQEGYVALSIRLEEGDTEV